MDVQAEQSELDELLRREGLPPKLLKLERRRERSNVWSAVLAGPMGDSNLEILVYALGDHPERFSDFEDDKAALAAMGSLGRAIEGDLVFDGRSDRLGVIVLAAADEAPIARKVRSMLLGGLEDTSVWYHVQLDRILGGTWVNRVGTAWTKSSLMAAERAMALHEATERLRAVSEGSLPDDALPKTLAIFEPDNVRVTVGGEEHDLTPHELLALPTMTLAPPRYEQLAQYVATIAEPHTVDRAEAAASAQRDLRGFATLLLSIVSHAHHRLAATFRSGAGCVLRPEFITPTGRLTDLYFLRLPDEGDGEDFSPLKVDDVFNALEVIRAVAGEPGEQLADALLAASESYAEARLAPALAELVHDFGMDPSGDLRGLRVLAVELRRGR